MKILMLTPYLPYPDSSGGQIRTQNLLKHLRSKHDITLFSLIKHRQEEKYVPILEKNFCKKVRVFYRPEKPWMLRNILRTGFSLHPFLVVRNFSKSAKRAIEEELRNNNYDLIHVETFYAMPHIPPTLVPVVLVDQTIEFKVYEHYVRHTANPLIRPLMTLDVLKLKYWEKFYWCQANKVIAVSQADRLEMLKFEPDLDVDIVPNGANLDFFKKKTTWSDKTPKLLFVSNFNWLQNTEAANILIDEIFPIVQKEVPTAKVLIVGQHHPDSLMAKASSSVIMRKLTEKDTDGISRAYHEATVFVSPIKGPGGTRLKNLGAMASQLPIVSTSVGVDGLGVKDGQQVIIKDTPQEMAQAIIKLLKSPQKAKVLAWKARRFVEDNFDYKVIAQKLDKIYREVAQK